jgi:DNA-binding NarL/FixJ family response regulator
MKLLLADDHTLFRDALVQYIQRSDENAVITLAKDFPEVMKAMDRDPHQDLVLLDLKMPGMEGLNGLAHLRKRYPHVRVALMSGVAESCDVKEALDMGASGYFPKTLPGDELLSAMKRVLADQVFVPMDAKGHFPMPSYHGDKNFSSRAQGANTSSALDKINLTGREREVLSYLSSGASNKEIAAALGLQIVTIKLHVRGICRKLGAKNRTQAALKAKELVETAR